MKTANYIRVTIYILCITSLLYITNASAENNTDRNGVKNFDFFDGARNKQIKVIAWYPITAQTQVTSVKGIWKQADIAINAPLDLQIATVKNGKLPLIVLSHGFHGNPESLSWLATSLVKQGFIVVAPQHNDSGPDKSKPFMEHWQRAIDISFILRELQHTEFAKHIDFSRIGMVGYSLGTATGLWLAGAIALSYERTVSPGRQFVPEEEFPELGSEMANDLIKNTDFQAAKKNYREPLIKAIFLIAPGYGWAFPAKQLANVSIPVFLVAAEKDEMLYPETNAYYLSKFLPNSVMKIIPDVGHFIFINETYDDTDKQLSQQEKTQIKNTLNFGLFRYSTSQRFEVQQLVGNLAGNFFLATLK